MKADQVISYEVISGLDLLDTHAVELYIRSILNERKLDLDFIQSVVALFATNPLFLGRGQFIAFILDSITSNELPHQAISRFMKGLTEPQSPLFPLKYYAEELKNRPSDMNNLGLILRKGLIEFLFKGSATFRVQNQQALDMIHYGFGFPQVIDGRIQTVELQELATVESLRRLIPVSDLVPDICVRLSTFPKPQCAGYVLEYLVGMALVMNLKAEATKNLKSTRGNLAAYLRVCDEDDICFPDHCCGPDIVYKLGDVVYLIQINFVDEISKQERVDACHTTDPMAFYTNKNTGRVLDGWTATKEAVLHELKGSNCQISRLVFLHTSTKVITDMDGVEVINQTNSPTFFDKLNPQLWNIIDSESSSESCDSEPVLHVFSNQSKIFTQMQLPYFGETDVLSEIGGSLGDLGTLVPILVSLCAAGQANLTTSLLFGGIFNIIAGLWFKIPMCVQPMKAIAAVALSTHLSAAQLATAGFTTSSIILLLTLTNLLTPIYRLCPLPLIRGIQLGTGLSLVTKGMTSILNSGTFSGNPGTLKFWSDNYIVALVAFVGVLALYPRKRLNFTAIVLIAYSLIIALISVTTSSVSLGGIGPAFPSSLLWSNVTGVDFKLGFLNAGLGQLPLTLLNSVFATSKLADDLFPERKRPVSSVRDVGVFVGLMNVIGVWFGSIPYCAGSGGLAGQYRFGARSPFSVVFLGVCKIIVGLLFGKALLPVIQAFPGSVMGVMLVISGVELASAMRDLTVTEKAKLKDSPNGFLVAFVGGSVVVASGNDGIGFLVASVTAFVLWMHEVNDEEKEKREMGVSDGRSLARVAWDRIKVHVKDCFMPPHEELNIPSN
ncbi:hypothetical protein HDU79_006413 [Rhizoclosmatium sp. JEL0117]|nr:hypothetical protein HDU79_006413 [Rhizoclosmatium sp. JEL0117]